MEAIRLFSVISVHGALHCYLHERRTSVHATRRHPNPINCASTRCDSRKSLELRINTAGHESAAYPLEKDALEKISVRVDQKLQSFSTFSATKRHWVTGGLRLGSYPIKRHPYNTSEAW